MYWIDQGLVKLISLNRRGDELIVALRPSGWILGAASVIVQKPYPVTALTLTDCQLIRLPAHLFLSLAQTNAKFSWVVEQVHSREIYDQVSQIIELGSLTARQRLEQFLLHWVSPLEPAGPRKVARLSAIAQAPPAGDGAPVFYFPQKEQYVTKESDPFLILVGIKDTSPGDIRFVLLKPTPGFVQLRPLCSFPDSTSAQTLVSIAPQPGDAGKYEVSLGATRGDAEPAAPFLRLIVKVKRAQ